VDLSGGQTLLYTTLRFDCCGVHRVDPASPHATARVVSCPECGGELVVKPVAP
jgi:hypothetical protein